MDYQRHFKDINERMEHLVCFFPFFKAYAQKRDYDAPYLALGVLTFLIEKGRLQGRTVRLEEIREYIEPELPIRKHIGYTPQRILCSSF